MFNYTLSNSTILSTLQNMQNYYKSVRRKNRQLCVIGIKESHLLREGSKKIDIILLPSLYRIKKTTLPVHKSSDAQTLAPSIFDGLIPSDEKYDYVAYPIQNGQFVLIAFSKIRIRQSIIDVGINPKNIGDIFFAQSEFSSLKDPISFGGEKVILVDDGVVFYLPSCYVENNSNWNTIQKKFQSSFNTYSYHFFEDHTMDPSSLNITYLIAGAIIAVFLIQISVFKKIYDQLQEEKTVILSTNNLPLSTLLIQNVKEGLLKKESQQYTVRESIHYLQSFPFQHKSLGTDKKENSIADTSASSQYLSFENERIESISIRDEHIDVVFILQSDKRAEAIRNYLSKRFKIESIVAKGTRISVRASLW